MSSSVSHLRPVVHPFGDNHGEERLRGLTHQQLADRLTWLAWWSPGAFTVVMDYMEFVDDLAADGGLDPDDPAPYCTACGCEVGIFLRSSLNWQHYRVTGSGSTELFDPGHAPEVGWRVTAAEPV